MNVVDFSKAERNAKKRDLELENLKYALEHGGIQQELLEKALTTLNIATGKEHYIGTKKAPQSRVRFVQSMQENLQFLYEKEYLTGREKIFLMDITPYIAFSSNCIVLDIKTKHS